MKNRGFTLVELITVMAIIAIVAALAVPGMQNFIESSRISTVTNDFVEAATLARSEAIKRRENTSLKPSDGANWKNGWAVYDAADTVIASYDPPSSNISFSFPDGVTEITYNLNGNRQGGADVKVSVCADSGKGRSVTIGMIGSTSVEKIESGCQ